MSKETNVPPRDAQRIFRVADLPHNRAQTHFTITSQAGDVRTVRLSKRRRQVIELLMNGPVYCASPVRISDIVSLLKQETGVEIHTEYYAGDPTTGAGTFGVYFLKSQVSHTRGEEAA